MTSAEMWQEFEVLLDKLDTENVPDIPVEQFFILLNVAIDEYMQAARIAFETTRKISEDVSPLVKRGYILPQVEEDRTIFKTDEVLSNPLISTSKIAVYYTLNGFFKSTYIFRDKTYSGTTEMVIYQQDDITVKDPFSSKTPDKVKVVLEDHSIIATNIPNLDLELFVGTFLLKPAKVSRLTNCNLAEPIHHTLVNRSVELALEIVESNRQKTFN